MVTSTFRILAVSAVALCAATAQPVVNAVLNNASYTLPGLPNSAIAQGSLMAIFGTGLGGANAMTATALPLTTNMGGTSVTISAGGRTLSAPMVYTTAGQLGAILPSDTPAGSATLTVTYNSQTSQPRSFTVARSSFGIFTSNQAGSGPGAVQNVISGTEQPINALNRPARPGQTVILWGTGLGPASSDVNIAAGDLPVDVEVWVGGRRATVTYKGRSGCCVGIDQLAFVIPEGVEGCFVPVVINVGGVVSNFASVAVARSGNACSDPTGFSAQDIETAQNNGTLRTGSITLTRTNLNMSVPGVGSVQMKTDIGIGAFTRFNLNQLLVSQGTGGESLQVSPGACSVMTYRANDENSRPVDPIRATPLDAGNAITVRGPKGEKQLTKRQGNADAYYGELGGGGISGIPGLPGNLPNIPGLPQSQPDFLEPGSYTISAPGGSGANSIGNFSVSFTMPQMVTWSNQSAVSNGVTRSAGQQITWTGGDANSYVYMSGMSFAQGVAGMFYCIERASAGQFTIPSYVLSTLPATTGNNIGMLMVGGTSAAQRFTARDLDAGYITAASMTQQSVSYR